MAGDPGASCLRFGSQPGVGACRGTACHCGRRTLKLIARQHRSWTEHLSVRLAAVMCPVGLCAGRRRLTAGLWDRGATNERAAGGSGARRLVLAVSSPGRYGGADSGYDAAGHYGAASIGVAGDLRVRRDRLRRPRRHRSYVVCLHRHRGGTLGEPLR